MVRGIQINDGTDLERSLLDMPVGKVLDVVVERGGEQQTLQFTIGIGRSTANAAVVSSGATDNSRVEARTVSASSDTKDLPAIALTEPANNGSAAADPATPEQDQVLAKVWDMFGLRLDALDVRDQQSLRGRYKGGMKISQVRTGGLGARHGLRTGDILVGLDDYETLGPANLKFILGDDRLKALNSISFLILRAGSVPPLTGQLDLRSVKR